LKKVYLFLVLIFSAVNAFADIIAAIEIGSKGIKAIALDYKISKDKDQMAKKT
jgi:hypothetical protein